MITLAARVTSTGQSLISLHGVCSSSRHKDPVNVQRSVDVIRTISLTYGGSEYADVVTMLQLLNEPKLFADDEDLKTVTKQYYLDAYEAARRPWIGYPESETDWIIVLHDGFLPLSFWTDYMVGDGFRDIWTDSHEYQAFGEEYYNISAEEHLRVS